MLWNTDPNPSTWSQWPGCLNELFQRTSIAFLEKDSLKYSSQDSLSISNKLSVTKSWVQAPHRFCHHRHRPVALLHQPKNILVPLTRISRLKTQATIFLVPKQPG
jgi:hypothetical protein